MPGSIGTDSGCLAVVWHRWCVVSGDNNILWFYIPGLKTHLLHSPCAGSTQRLDLHMSLLGVLVMAWYRCIGCGRFSDGDSYWDCWSEIV